MARSRGGSRPTAQRSAPVQQRPASTAAARAPQHQQPAQAHPQQQQGSQPGLFANMASTAAGVAVGSAVGHTIGAGLTSMFGGSSSAPVEQQQQDTLPAQQNYATQQTQGGAACDVDARNFTRCLGENEGNMQICDYYLQQLKACQEASRQY
jgi:hypothetical protein